MKNIDFKVLLKNNWIHFLAIALFFLGTFLYFQPQFNGYGLKQHDIEQFKGMSNEIFHHRETVGEEPLWTNSMFGGMPTYQISTYFEGNLFGKVAKVFHLWMKSPAGIFFSYLIGFYIMLLCLRVNAKIAILGAFAFAFSSYYIIILQAGHDTKALAIGFAPPVIGAFYMAYRYSIKWGILLSAFFMGLQLYANHPQVTYYLGIVMAILGISELFIQLKDKTIGRFLKVTVMLLVAYVFAAGVNYGKLSLTLDYAKHTIRGGNDITIHTDGTSNAHIATSGLDKDYITQWSYGVDESLTLVSPNVKGGASAALGNSQFSDMLRSPEHRKQANLVAQNNVYWGDQPFTSGPVYLGVIVFLLAVLGMVYLKGPKKWALFAATLLALMLSWGKNFMGLTDFFIDYVPFYNKFRAVTIILAMVELTVPLLAVLFLDELWKNKEEIKRNIKPFYITSGVLVASFLVLTVTGLGDGYLSEMERSYVYDVESQVKAQLTREDPQMLLENGIDINNPDHIQQVVKQQMDRVDEQFGALVDVRKSIYQSSMLRSVFFLLVGIALVFVLLKTNIKKEYALIGLGLFIVIDLVQVDLNYLNSNKSNGRTYDYWVEQAKKDFPVSPTKMDKEVLEQELAENPALKPIIDAVKVKGTGERGRINQDELWLKKLQTLGAHTNFRVFEPAIGFNSSRASYFHKALNGYHGAKLRRIQNVKDFHIDYNNMAVINMLNVKYLLQNGQAMKNSGALGAAWLIKEVNVQDSPNKELLALGNVFTIENHTQNQLFVNQEEVTNAEISGRERLVLFATDSIRINIENATRYGVNSTFVEDVNGERNWIPTAELAKDSLDSFTPLVSIALSHEFNPAAEVIVGEDVASQLSASLYDANGTIEMTSYAPNELTYNFVVQGTQFAVFSEMYYADGWNAYIDGKQVDIHRVNYLLRGIELPDGAHELVMKFEVPKYKTSNQVALAGSALLLLVMAGLFVKDFLLEEKNTQA